MEQLYNIVIAKPNFPFESLTYLSTEKLSIGCIVQVEIKNAIFYGMVISESNLTKSQIKNLKNITNITPFVISSIQLEFLKKISFLTFNSLANLLTLTIKPYETIFESKEFKNSVILSSTGDPCKISTTKKLINPKLDYIISKSWASKILEKLSEYTSLSKEVARSDGGCKKLSKEVDGSEPDGGCYKNKNILILFPEKNILTSIQKELESLNMNKNILIHNLNTTSEKKLLNIYQPLLSITNDTTKINVILGNKNSIFFNLDNIDELIIIDEANPSYISEHRIYFDAREVAFWASKIYNFNLTFISTLPSVRFLDLSRDKLQELTIPKVNIKFLERQGRQNDFENILLELENDGDLIVD
jgi:primosomal protein N'